MGRRGSWAESSNFLWPQTESDRKRTTSLRLSLSPAIYRTFESVAYPHRRKVLRKKGKRNAAGAACGTYADGWRKDRREVMVEQEGEK